MHLVVRNARTLACAGLLAAMVWALGLVGARPAAAAAKELLVYDWNRAVTKADRGFPRDFPPHANGNWKVPVNFAEGTFYIRVQIKQQPKVEQNWLQFCVWQDHFHGETCTSPSKKVVGSAGNV